MYRALYGFIDMQGVVGEVTFATSNAIKGSLILIMIAVGVDIPNVFMRKWVSMKHQKRLVNMVQNRERCGKFVDIDKVE